MDDDDQREVIELFWRALADKRLEEAATMLHDDFVEEWPQSGERIRGRDNWLSMATGHPAFPAVEPISHEGYEDLWVTQAHFEYPMEDGPAPFEVCSIQRLREGKLLSITEYFAAPFEAAEWRAGWVERTD